MEALRCENCGGGLRAQDARQHFQCPYCGYRTELSADAVARAGRYRADVDRYAAQAAEQVRVAQAYADIAGGDYGRVQATPAPIAGNQCHACGAPTRFETGALHSHCVYCGASLLAGAETQGRGLVEAARAYRATRLDALKSERHFAVELAKTYRNMARFKAALLVLLPLGGTIALALGNQPDREIGTLAGIGMTIAGTLILIGLSLRRRSELERAAAAVGSVARAGNGRVLSGTRAVAQWLNTHWWDEYRAYDLSFPYDSRAAAGEMQGLAVLVIAAPPGANDTSFLDVLVSAWYEGRSERGEGPLHDGDPGLRRALRAQGFTLRSGPSGIHARLTDEPRRRLREGIDLGNIAEQVTRLAISQGGRHLGA
ncbi:MAG TPA: hypothetical protein VGK73_09775 [Polyangiaceae bacterium]